jgi:hypothetical protein
VSDVLVEIGGAMDFTGWTTKDVVTAIVATGAISALLTNVFGGVRDWIGWRWKSKKDASYMAMRLANALEAYPPECVNLIYANGEIPRRENEQYPRWSTDLPTVGAYPDDPIGWKAIDPDLADRCLRLPNSISGCQSLIHNTVEYNEDSVQTEVARHASDLGLEAWDIAVKLRKIHGLPELKPVWDYPKALRDRRMFVISDDSAKERHSREFWEDQDIRTAE